MKKEYKKPLSRTYKLALPLMDSIGWGGSVPDGEANESKGATYLIDDDDDFFGNRSTSFSEAEVYSHYDL